MTTQSLRSRLKWPVLLALAALGVTSVVFRVLMLTGHTSGIAGLPLSTSIAMFPAHTAEFRQLEQHFASTATMTFVHVIAGGIFLTLGLLQFSPRVRDRHRQFHRTSGRILATIGFIAGGTGLWMGIVDPFSSNERLPAAFIGAVFLVSPAVAIAAIRRGDISRHREWMIRFYAAGIASVFVRLFAPIVVWLFQPAPVSSLIGLTFWAGAIVSQGAAELWIRSRRDVRAAVLLPA